MAALAATLGMTPTACAWGIHRVVNENLETAVDSIKRILIDAGLPASSPPPRTPSGAHA